MDHPERLGRYAITGVLGEGAMGVVYKGYDPVIKRPLAIKTIRRQLDDGDDAVDSFAARFRNEAEAAGRLQHPGIVAVYEYGEDGGRAYITMEFVEGTSLAQLLARKTAFTPAQAVHIIAQLLEALHHAHEQGVWHRDIKPANLILTPTGRVKITDFGIARIESAGLTQVTMTIGTPGHMAPEQYVGSAIDRRVDVFASGVLLYQLLAGRPPFSGSAESVMYKVLNEEPLPPSQAAAAPIPADYDDVAAQALARRVDERFATAAAFRRALLDAHARAALEATVADAAPRSAGRAGDEASRVAAGGGAGRAAPEAARRPAATAVGGSAAAASGAGVTRLTEGGAPPTGWDATVLKPIELALATQVGPMARVLVSRAARECRDLGALQRALAAQIPDEPGRTAFAAALARSGLAGPSAAGVAPSGSGPAVPAAATTAAPPLDPALVEQAQKLLARRIGPIARVLAKKAAAESGDRERFQARLADYVEDADERTALLAELRALR